MSPKKQLLLIKQYHSQGMSIRQIAKKTRLSKYRVEISLKDTGQLESRAKDPTHVLDPFRDEVQQWLERKMTARLIYKRLSDKGVQTSESSVQRYVRLLKQPEVYVHVPTEPFKESQVDFGYLGRFNKDGKMVKVWVFCQVLSHSRYAFYKAVTDQTTQTFINCQIDAFEFFGGVTATVKIDNLGAGVLEADFYQPLIQRQYADMMNHYGATVITCRVRRGQDKGIVESGIKYVKNSFLKGLETRDFYELEAQLAHWNARVCNLREHGTLRSIPRTVFLQQEKRHLLPLPIRRHELVHYEPRTVNQFGHIYYRYNQYSVPAYLAGEPVLIASNGSILRIFCNDEQVAMHLIDPKKGQNITENHHQPIYKRAKTTEYYRQLLEIVGNQAVRLLDQLIEHHPYEWKKMCVGIRKLADKHGNELVNRACKETLACSRGDYRTVKKITLSLKGTTTQAIVGQEPTIHSRGYFHDLKKYDRFVTTYTE